MNIAIIGAGIAGLSASFLLREQGHRVVLFEQAQKCLPVGAGILLQPSGQHVLSELGLLDKIEEHSPKLHGLLAQCRSGRPLVSLRYDKLSPELYGLGVRRSLLFSVLLERCERSGVEFIEDAQIESARQFDNKVELCVKNQKYNFDLVVAADGSRSTMRQICFPETYVKQYSYAALWTLAPCNTLTPKLWQIVDGTKRLLGVLPVEKNLCSFFWGIQQNEKDQIWKDGINKWKEEVLNFEPSLSEIVNSIESLEQLSFATYRHVRMKKYYQDRIVFIGDAAHASSPHLGQGVNLALEDALTLANEFSKSSNYNEIYQSYQSKRHYNTKYYSQLTAILTPFFQSDFEILGLGRNLILPILPHIPFVGGQMTSSMAGLKRGWFDFKARKLGLK